MIEDHRNTPRYGIAQAARYIPGLSPSTLRSWCFGRTYPVQDGLGQFAPLIELPDPEDRRLSFINLVEAHVLYGLRSRNKLSIQDLRIAMQYAEQEFRIQHLLTHREVRYAAGSLFIERYGQQVSLSKAGQLGMKKVLELYLERLVHGEDGVARKLFPLLTWAPDRRDYVIDPEVAYGRPIVAAHGVTVATIADRYDGGETIETLAGDYGLDAEEVEMAITYAQAA